MRITKKLILIMLIMLTIESSVAFAESPFETYSFNRNGEPILTQSAYQAIGIIDGENIGTSGDEKSSLSSPDDLFIDENDDIYVADSGNGRIVVFDKSGNYKKTIGDGVLSQPTGVFVTSEGMVVVADYRNEKLFQFDQTGEVVKEIGRPDTMLFGKKTPFKPKKVIVDKRNNFYVVSEGSIHGLIQLSSEGEFLGYFGANITGFSLKRSIQRLVFTNEQLSRIGRVLPSSITNVEIDEEGLIYSTTMGVQMDEIKKLNVAGNNLLPSQGYSFTGPNTNATAISGVTINEIGNMLAVDTANALIYEYDREGNILFVFGGQDTGNLRLGLFSSPIALDINSEGVIHVLDNQRNKIQLLRPTEFTSVVHEAIALYNDGKYVESEKYWEEVFRYNSMFDFAQTGLGMAAFKRGDYELALSSFERSKDKKEYSNAYWELRREWLMKNVTWVLLSIIGFVIVRPGVRMLHRRTGFATGFLRLLRKMKNQRIIKQLLHSFRIFRHPFEGFYELRNEGKVSFKSATILYVSFFIVYLFELYNTSFLFSSADASEIILTTKFYTLFVPIFAWVVSNYLVSTISDGEGRLIDVYNGTAYALTPYIIFGIPLALLSNGLTMMEQVIYTYSKIGIIMWCCVLVVLMVKEVHDYEIGKTIKNILITIFGMVMIGIIGFIVFGLANQVWDFIYTVIQEVSVRG